MPLLYPASVLVEHHVQYPVQSILDPPVATDQLRHLQGRPGVAADVVVTRRRTHPTRLAPADHLRHRLDVRPAPGQPFGVIDHRHRTPLAPAVRLLSILLLL